MTWMNRVIVWDVLKVELAIAKPYYTDGQRD